MNEAQPNPYSHEGSMASGRSVVQATALAQRSAPAPGHNGRMWHPVHPDVPTRFLCELVGKVLTELAVLEEDLVRSFRFSPPILEY